MTADCWLLTIDRWLALRLVVFEGLIDVVVIQFVKLIEMTRRNASQRSMVKSQRSKPACKIKKATANQWMRGLLLKMLTEE